MPSGGRPSADVVGMVRARNQFENAASAFADQLRRVDDEVDSLRSTWTGSTSVEFGSAVDDWEDDFAVVIRELRAVAEAMGGGTAAFATRDEPRPPVLEA